MCEFCVRHGDGKRWYLNAANYAQELLEDARRAKYIEDFIPGVRTDAARWLRIYDRAYRVAPGITRRVGARKSRQLQGVHFGQVVPLEDVDAILAVAGHVVRLPCVCRSVLEQREVAACYVLAASPDRLGFRELLGRREEAAPFVAGMERVDRETAVAEMAALEDGGAVHTVWTFITPFIGAICNCDPAGCLALNFTRRGLPLYLPGETRGAVDAAACAGCGECVAACHFGALAVGPKGVAEVDVARCQGCGICRRRCPTGALALTPAG